MVSLGAVKNGSKDINEAADGLCIGVALEDGVRFGPPPDKLTWVLAALLQMLVVKEVSPLGLASANGVVQW